MRRGGASRGTRSQSLLCPGRARRERAAAVRLCLPATDFPFHEQRARVPTRAVVIRWLPSGLVSSCRSRATPTHDTANTAHVHLVAGALPRCCVVLAGTVSRTNSPVAAVHNRLFRQRDHRLARVGVVLAHALGSTRDGMADRSGKIPRRQSRSFAMCPPGNTAWRRGFSEKKKQKNKRESWPIWRGKNVSQGWPRPSVVAVPCPRVLSAPRWLVPWGRN